MTETKAAKVTIQRGELSTSATVARAFITAGVAESTRDCVMAMSFIGAAIDELEKMRSTITDNPAKG